MDRIEAMTLLLAAVEKGSLSAGARANNIPVSTLTRKVTDLEAFLGVRLLTRTTRKLGLTEAGAIYVAAARTILEQIDAQEREASGEFSIPRGELVVATPVQFGRQHVLPIIDEFLAQFTKIKIRLLQSDRNVDLIDSHADVAVRIGPLPASNMVATRVGALRVVVCASPSLLARWGVPKVPADLVKLPSVLFESPYLSPWRFRGRERDEKLTIAPDPRLQVSAPDSAADAAIAGVGVTMLLEHDVDRSVRNKQLKIILPNYELDPLPVHLLHISRNLMPLKLRSFMDFATPRLRKSLAHYGNRQGAHQ